MFVPNFKILSQVVSEKSLTEKKFTDKQTSVRKRQKLYTPYILRIPGGIIILTFIVIYVYKGYKNINGL